jgi:D-3-phosphoglycerate dehydrogenase / 2-oxoglutarate reductase
MDKVVFAGSRLFMKFLDFDYFTSRLKEADAEVIMAKDEDPAALVRAAADAAAIVVIARPITAELIDTMKIGKFIMTMSVGYNCVDIKAATRKGIPVSNCPIYCSDDVANHAMTLLLSVSRKIHHIIQKVKTSNWDYKYTKPIYNYRGKKLGILGLGRIGRTILPKAKGFGMKVAAYDPYIDDDIFHLLDVEHKYELHDLLSDVDYLTIHAPLTPETRHIIDLDAFKMMKKDAVIINTARGSIIDQKALCEALEQGIIGGAGIDVLESEPPEKDHPLISQPNALVTPHIAWYSEESYEANKIQGMDELVRVLNGSRPRHLVNPEIYN